MRRSFSIALFLAAGCGGATSGSSYLVYVRDRQGSVVAAVDDQGQKVWETHDDAFGLRLSSSGTEVPREFLDQPFDDETGFYQFHYRTFDPATAQWLSPDPMLISNQEYCAQSPELCNPYAYAGDRPGEWTDPDGRESHQDASESGRTYHVTFGVFGAYAQDVAADLQNIPPLVLKGSPDKADFTIHMYATRDQVRPDETPVDANLCSDRSLYYPDDSSIVVGRDTLRDALTAAEILFHEIIHGFSGREGYVGYTSAIDGKEHSVSIYGQEHSVMGDLQLSPVWVTKETKAETDYPAQGDEANMGLSYPSCPSAWMNGDLSIPALR